MKKKSYMNQKNILSEGMVDQIIQWFKQGKTRKAVDAAEKRYPGIKNNVKKINDLNRGIEDYFKEMFGTDIELVDYKVSDFLKENLGDFD